MPGRSNESSRNELVFAKQVNEIPDYSNDATRATEQEIVAFVFDEDMTIYGDDLISRGPYELDNRAIYHG